MRLLAAAALVTGLLAPATASADPVDPPCRLYWGEPVITGTGPLEGVEVRRPGFVC